MPFFFATERNGDEVVIAGRDARHLAGPLRARAGELIQVVEPAGSLLGVRLTRVSAREVVGLVEWSRPHAPEPRARVTLAVAMLPAAGLEYVLSRATELGAAGFLLVRAERSVGRADKSARWATICREAAMLAGRLLVPPVRGPVALAEAFGGGPFLMLQRDAPQRLAELAASSPRSAGDEIVLAIGPEGGWSPAEIALAGTGIASLGPRNLRADTAAVAACATWLAARGDL